MGSSRLPGKVLKRIGDKTMLEWVLYRLGQVEADIGPVIVATSSKPPDKRIAELCEQAGALCYRGSLDDVLDRYYTVATRCHADAVVRVTADCPLLSPRLLSDVHACFVANDLDYCSTARNVAEGLGQEMVGFAALEQAWKRATGADREHVTTHFSGRAGFRVGWIPGPESGLSYSIDTPHELERLRGLYERHPDLFDLEAEQIIEIAEQQALKVAA